MFFLQILGSKVRWQAPKCQQWMFFLRRARKTVPIGWECTTTKFRILGKKSCIRRATILSKRIKYQIHIDGNCTSDHNFKPRRTWLPLRSIFGWRQMLTSAAWRFEGLGDTFFNDSRDSSFFTNTVCEPRNTKWWTYWNFNGRVCKKRAFKNDPFSISHTNIQLIIFLRFFSGVQNWEHYSRWKANLYCGK